MENYWTSFSPFHSCGTRAIKAQRGEGSVLFLFALRTLRGCRQYAVAISGDLTEAKELNTCYGNKCHSRGPERHIDTGRRVEKG